eukprot:366454-Chlamydomonas_euryale.AAC.19
MLAAGFDLTSMSKTCSSQLDNEFEQRQRDRNSTSSVTRRLIEHPRPRPLPQPLRSRHTAVPGRLRPQSPRESQSPTHSSRQPTAPGSCSDDGGRPPASRQASLPSRESRMPCPPRIGICACAARSPTASSLTRRPKDLHSAAALQPPATVAPPRQHPQAPPHL